MALTYSKPTDQTFVAPDFNLVGVDDQNYSLKNFSHSKALLVIFMCNHCPYVIAVQDRINDLAKKYSAKGVSVVGINSNDSVRYEADSFENMKLRAKEKGYVFPYLWDKTQKTAKDYDAVCTPDPYLFENVGGQFVLRYRGRIDDNWKDESQVQRHELSEAIEAVLENRPTAQNQHPAMGCSIKWL